MTTIIKRSGREEPYDPEKLKNALAVTGDEAGSPLTQSDLNNVADEVSRMLDGREKAYSRDIFIMTAGLLYIRGLRKVLECYTGHPKNAWKF